MINIDYDEKLFYCDAYGNLYAKPKSKKKLFNTKNTNRKRVKIGTK